MLLLVLALPLLFPVLLLMLPLLLVMLPVLLPLFLLLMLPLVLLMTPLTLIMLPVALPLFFFVAIVVAALQEGTCRRRRRGVRNKTQHHHSNKTHPQTPLPVAHAILLEETTTPPRVSNSNKTQQMSQETRKAPRRNEPKGLPKRRSTYRVRRAVGRVVRCRRRRMNEENDGIFNTSSSF